MSEETTTGQKFIVCTNYDGLDKEPTLVSSVTFGGTAEEVSARAYEWLLGLLDGDKGVKPLTWYDTMYISKEGLKIIIDQLIEKNIHLQNDKANYSHIKNYKDHVGFWYRRNAMGSNVPRRVRRFSPRYHHKAIRSQSYKKNMYKDWDYGCRALKKPRIDIRTVAEYKDYLSTGTLSTETVTGFVKKARKDFMASWQPLQLLFDYKERGLKLLITPSVFKSDKYSGIFGYRAHQDIKDIFYVLLGVDADTKPPKDFKTLSSLAYYHQLNFGDGKIAEHCLTYATPRGRSLYHLIQIQWLCLEAFEFDKKCDRVKYEKIFELAQKQTVSLAEETNDNAALNGYYRRGNDAQEDG